MYPPSDQYPNQYAIRQPNYAPGTSYGSNLPPQQHVYVPGQQSVYDYNQANVPPPPYQPQIPAPAQPFDGTTTPGFLPGIPMNLISAGNLLSGGRHWGQDYVEKVQQNMGWLSGSSLNFLFAISNKYVASKLLMLLAPYLRRWTFNRQPEQIQGGQKFLPPRLDVNAPDLFIPIISCWTYIILQCVMKAIKKEFRPDLVYNMVWGACIAWFLHLVTAKVILKAMNLSASVPWLEVAAYVGYAFVPVSIATLAGTVSNYWVYLLVWLYGSLCMSVFLIRTIKRIIHFEHKSYGSHMMLTNYLLLGLASLQFPYCFWLSSGI